VISGNSSTFSDWQNIEMDDALLLAKGEFDSGAAAATAGSSQAAELWSSSTEEPAQNTQPPLKRPSFLDHLHLHPPDGQRRFGPYFEDGLGPFNVTARIGSTVLLDCRIGMLQDKTVCFCRSSFTSKFLTESLKSFKLCFRVSTQNFPFAFVYL
jgi:hypothetical protein